ncbi:DEAD/DEAH box helicase family protein [Kitasatospora sp. NPDC001574]
MTNSEWRSHAAARHAPAVKTISELQAGQVVQIYVPTGTGKTRFLAAAAEAFIKRNPHARVLMVTHSLRVAQQADTLAEQRIEAALIRDQDEMRAWLFHSAGSSAPVLVVAQNLIGSTAEAALLEIGFGLVVLDDAAMYLTAVARLITAGKSAVVVTGNPSALGQAALALQDIKMRRIHAPSLADAAIAGVANTLKVETVPYQVGTAERTLIDDVVHFLAQRSPSASRQTLRAAASSRAAFTAALLQPRLERLGVSGTRGSRAERMHGETDSQDHYPAQEGQDALFGSELMPKIPDTVVDSFLDRVDDLEVDGKLLALLKILDGETDGGRGSILFVQSPATAAYAEQFLTANVADAVCLRLDSLQRDNPDQMSIFGGKEIFIVSDNDLPYLRRLSANYHKIWFDLPASTAHGQQRQRFSKVETGFVPLLWADPPLLTPEEFEGFGIQLVSRAGLEEKPLPWPPE